ENLDKYLIEFESNFNKLNGELIWALNAQEARNKIAEILATEKIDHVIKSKSMVTEEIELNSFLLHKNISVVETDLGEFIQQISQEPPSHIVTPCVHKSKNEINSLLSEKLNIPAEISAQELTRQVHIHLNESLSKSIAGITGANFLIADTGAIAITENEGNAFFCATTPKIHIVIAGIEKIIPSVKDLELFWPLLSSFATGQSITAYNHVISGGKNPNEKSGPEKFYLILLDNGRSDLLAKPEQRSALACIKCGACYNVCPVYKNIGGHSYDFVYGGPIGKVISPHLSKEKNLNHLSHASSLCGACSEICPVKIPIHKLLLANRKEDSENISAGEKIIWAAWKKAMLNRKTMDMGGALAKNAALSLFFKKLWGNDRELPKVAKKSFNQVMRERLKINS
ncbi:MAG: LUD domain-containing protein, partial [Bacteroidota bacterium]